MEKCSIPHLKSTFFQKYFKKIRKFQKISIFGPDFGDFGPDFWSRGLFFAKMRLRQKRPILTGNTGGFFQKLCQNYLPYPGSICLTSRSEKPPKSGFFAFFGPRPKVFHSPPKIHFFSVFAKNISKIATFFSVYALGFRVFSRKINFIL